VTHHWGYVSAVASALLFGTSSTLNKIALEDVHPTLIAGMIYFIGGVFLFGIHFSPLSEKILALFGSPEIEPKIAMKDFRTLAFVILCGSVATPLLLLNGLNQTTAINTSLLLNAESVYSSDSACVSQRTGNQKRVFGHYYAADRSRVRDHKRRIPETHLNRKHRWQSTDSRSLLVLGNRQ